MSNPVMLFQQARSILCLCPCCGEVIRLSELNLRYKGVTPITWLDTYDKKLRRFDKAETRFEEEKKSIREASRERGRKKAKRAVRKIVHEALPGCNYDPKDIKAVLFPVDYVVFCGMTDKTEQIKNVTFLSKTSSSARLQRIRQSLETTINRENYEWQLIRIADNGDISIE